jgi:hypothetical protein
VGHSPNARLVVTMIVHLRRTGRIAGPKNDQSRAGPALKMIGAPIAAKLGPVGATVSRWLRCVAQINRESPRWSSGLWAMDDVVGLVQVRVVSGLTLRGSWGMRAGTPPPPCFWTRPADCLYGASTPQGR